jgi:hypothetical protein
VGDFRHLPAGIAESGCQHFSAFPVTNIDELERPATVYAAVKDAIDEARLHAHFAFNVVLPKRKEPVRVVCWNSK